MRKDIKKAAFSIALAMGAVGQVAAPLANPIVAMAAENADLQSALVSSTSGNVIVEQYAAGPYSNNTWTVNEDSVTYVSERFKDGSVWYNKMPCLKLTVDAGCAKTLSFDMSNRSWGSIQVKFNSLDDNYKLSADSDGTYTIEIPVDVTEVYLVDGGGNKSTSQAEFTLSNLSVDYDETKDYHEIGEGFQVRIKDGVMTVDGTGEFDAKNKAGTGDGYGIPSISSDVLKTVTKIEFGAGITSIKTCEGMADASFGEWCPNVEEVVLPEGITNIGQYAFRGCSKLSSVNFPTSLSEIDHFAFSETALTSVILTDDMNVIVRQGAFKNIDTLKEIYLGAGTALWADGNFNNNEYVEKLTINMSSVDQYYTYQQFTDLGLNTAEGTEIIIGDNVTEIETIWFEDLGKIKSIHVSENVTKIGAVSATTTTQEGWDKAEFNQKTSGDVVITGNEIFINDLSWLGENINPIVETDDVSDSASISANSFTVKVGEAIDLDATVSGDMSHYKWIIGNADTNETEAVASIDEYGTVTGLKAGYAIVGIVNADNELLDQKSIVIIPAEYDSYDSWISGGGPLLSVGGQTVTPGGGYGYGFGGYTGGGSNSISGTVSGSITGGSSAGGSTGGGSGSTGGSEGSGSEGSGSEGSGSEGSGSGSEGGSGSGSGSEGSGSTGSNQNDMCITGYITPITEMDVTIPLDGFKFHIDENRDLIPTISNLENNSQFPLDVNALNINGSTGTEPSVIAANTYTQYEWDNMNKRNTLANMALYLNGEELYSVFQNDNLDTSKAINIGRLESGFSGTTQLEVTPGAQYGKNFGNKTETLTFVYDLVLEFEVPLA